MSAMLSSGLVGVSHQITRVVGRIAARTASRSSRSAGRVLDAPPREHPGEQPERAAVGVAGDDDVVAGLADGAQQGVLGGEARGERQPAVPSSSAASASCSAVRVGLALRLYS